MNVARSTFVRRGYLLTALAVAVLLAGSSGTAWAQTTGVSAQQPQGLGFLRHAARGRRPCRSQQAAALEGDHNADGLRASKNDPYNTSAIGRRTGHRTHLIINFEYNGDPGLPAWDHS